MTSTKVDRQHAHEPSSPGSNRPSLEGISGQVHEGLACLKTFKAAVFRVDVNPPPPPWPEADVRNSFGWAFAQTSTDESSNNEAGELICWPHVCKRMSICGKESHCATTGNWRQPMGRQCCCYRVALALFDSDAHIRVVNFTGTKSVLEFSLSFILVVFSGFFCWRLQINHWICT